MNENEAILQQKRSDLKLGYVIITFIFLIGLAVAGLGLFHFKTPDKVRVISFEKIGNLKIEDPVFLLGIRVGKVKSIELRKRSVIVAVNLDKPVRLHEGYHIDNMDIGIMGDRGILIDFGDTAQPLVPEKDTLAGAFTPGVSESVGLAWKLQSVVDSFVELSSKLLHSTPAHPSFVQQVNRFAAKTDSVSLALATVITRLGGALSGQLDTIDLLISGVARFYRQADTFAMQQLPAWQKQVGNISRLIERIEPMIEKLFVAMDKFEKLGSPDQKGTLSLLVSKIKELRDSVVRIKEGFTKLAKLGIQSL
jgi:hypothetical protein